MKTQYGDTSEVKVARNPRHVYFMGRWWMTDRTIVAAPEYSALIRDVLAATGPHQDREWFWAGPFRSPLSFQSYGNVRILRSTDPPF